MKNIHVLPTDNPSRLYKEDSVYKLDNLVYGTGNQNIYITSDEEIKEGDWCIDEDGLKKCTAHAGAMNHYFQKIILTTDVDLIKDGVQAIDDEFLEWFVKNPSCEFVEIEIKYNCKEIGNCIFDSYKIIIPKEELKQETLEEAALKYFPKTNSHFDRLDEVDGNAYYRSIFKLGAKWQQEQMYSEEELKSAFKIGFNIGYSSPVSELDLKNEYCEKWFEKFKKK